MKLLFTLLIIINFNLHADFDRCAYINDNLEGSYEVSLLKSIGEVDKVGVVEFHTTDEIYAYNAINLSAIGEEVIKSSTDKIKLVPSENGEVCNLVARAGLENNVIGEIKEGEDFKAFSVSLDDEVFLSIEFVKLD